MKPETIYWLLCIPGTVLPLSAFLPWATAYGLDIPLFIGLLFANPISSFFGWDVIVSAAVLAVFAYAESRRLGMRHWWLAVAATVCVGVSLGLPLFLALRERTLNARSA